MDDADRTTALAEALLAGANRTGNDTPDGDYLAGRTLRVVEAAVGDRTRIAEAIASRGGEVLATDVVQRTVPAPIDFRVDDLRDPRRGLYRDADLLYALRLPPELHDAFARLGGDADAPTAFTTLGGDPPTVATTPEQVPGGETIHWVERGERAAVGDR